MDDGRTVNEPVAFSSDEPSPHTQSQTHTHSERVVLVCWSIYFAGGGFHRHIVLATYVDFDGGAWFQEEM